MKTWVRLTLTAVLLAVAGVSLYQFSSFYFKKNEETKKQEAIREIIKDDILEEADFSLTREAWDSLYAANNDFVGYLSFPDEYVSEPVVKGVENEGYLYRSFDGTWSEFGTLYIDADNDLDDTNVVIYGHHVVGYGFEDMKFGPIAALVEQDAYDQHHEFTVWWQDKAAKYVITNVFYYDVEQDTKFDYKQLEFTESEFRDFKEFIDSKNEIVSDESLEYGDRFVTLQTCRDLWSSVRIIAVCKEISASVYE